MKWKCLAVIAAIVLGDGQAMADAADEKFALIQSEAPATEFTFADSSLDFGSVAPADFIWTDSDVIPPEFSEAGVFSAFRERYIGYDPLNRDRFEIRIYTAKIFPTRVAVGADYSRLLASVWGTTNFGVEAHSSEFGEVLGGDKSSGIMLINRIVVLRRGEELLILRLKFHAEHFETYAEAIAKFVGSIAFKNPLVSDPIKDALKPGNAASFAYEMPGNWERLDFSQANPEQGHFDIWIDADDPNRNLAALVAAIPSYQPIPDGAQAVADAQRMADVSASFAEVLIENVLPDTPFELSPLKKSEFDDFEAVSAFSSLFVFEAGIGAEPQPAVVSVLISMGNDGSVLGSAILSPRPIDQYLMGTDAHGNFAQKLQLDAQLRHWTTQQQ